MPKLWRLMVTFSTIERLEPLRTGGEFRLGRGLAELAQIFLKQSLALEQDEGAVLLVAEAKFLGLGAGGQGGKGRTGGGDATS